MLNTIIWGNLLIRWANKPIFEKQLVNSNIEKILDIYNVQENRFCTYKQVVDNFGVNFGELFYIEIIAAIPKMWKILIKNKEWTEPIDLESNFEKLVTVKQISKHVYWKLIEKLFPVQNTCKTLWEHDLGIGIDEDQWQNAFISFQKYVKSAKLQSFQFRVLQRGLTTNLKRSQWQKELSCTCTFGCGKTETVTHLLWECNITKDLWKKLEKFIFYFLEIRINFSMVCIILNNYSGPKKELINVLIAIMKQYVYTSKCFQKTPIFKEFVEKVSYWHLAEKHLMTTNFTYKNLVNFNKRWSAIF